jgi:hypothetical protein
MVLVHNKDLEGLIRHKSKLELVEIKRLNAWKLIPSVVSKSGLG